MKLEIDKPFSQPMYEQLVYISGVKIRINLIRV